MGKLLCDISQLSENLFTKAIDCLSYKDIYIYNEADNELNKNIIDKTTSKISQYWIIFSTGIELLLKAKLLKYNSIDINKKHIVKKIHTLNKSATNYLDCINVYDFVNSFEISSTKNSFINVAIEKNKISLLYEINLGTLGDCQSYISRLKKKSIITDLDYANLYNSIQVLLDVRRNFDIHNYSPLNVQGSINGDLDKLYLPMVNLLLKL
jgi:hypothetical protein